MAKTLDKLAAEIHDLPDVEKLRLVDAILADLNRPDPEIDECGRKRRANDGRLTKRAESQRYPMRPLCRSIAALESPLSSPTTTHLANFNRVTPIFTYTSS